MFYWILNLSKLDNNLLIQVMCANYGSIIWQLHSRKGDTAFNQPLKREEGQVKWDYICMIFVDWILETGKIRMFDPRNEYFEVQNSRWDLLAVFAPRIIALSNTSKENNDNLVWLGCTNALKSEKPFCPK